MWRLAWVLYSTFSMIFSRKKLIPWCWIKKVLIIISCMQNKASCLKRVAKWTNRDRACKLTRFTSKQTSLQVSPFPLKKVLCSRFFNCFFCLTIIYQNWFSRSSFSRSSFSRSSFFRSSLSRLLFSRSSFSSSSLSGHLWVTYEKSVSLFTNNNRDGGSRCRYCRKCFEKCEFL